LRGSGRAKANAAIAILERIEMLEVRIWHWYYPADGGQSGSMIRLSRLVVLVPNSRYLTHHLAQYARRD